MKNLFSKEKSPLQQMQESLSQYNDPCASFLAEGPKFYFGKETPSSPVIDPEEELGREFGGTHSRKLDTDYERRLDINKRFDGETDQEFFTRLSKERQERMPDLTDDEIDSRSELDRQADDLLLQAGWGPASSSSLDSAEDIDTIDISDSGEVIPLSSEETYDAHEDPFTDLDNPNELISASDDLYTHEEELEPEPTSLVQDSAREMKEIADLLSIFNDQNIPSDIKADLEILKARLESLKANMSMQEGKLVEAFGGEVVPLAGTINNIPLVSKYQSPETGEVFVKAGDGRILCVTMGMNGEPVEVKRTSFNPAFPQAMVTKDKAAIDILTAAV